jgi:hypothetical protein
MTRKLLAFFAVLAIIALAADPSEGCRRRWRCQSKLCAPANCAPVPVAPTITVKGRTHLLLDTIDQGFFEEPRLPSTAFAKGAVGPDTFHAKDRVTPKTTIVVGAPIEDFDSVGDLVRHLLKTVPDSVMADLGITRQTETRVKEENRNVRVTGFIYAFKKEGDNDYHVILGDAPDIANPLYLNVEVSGIPVGGTNANRQRLISVRQVFKETLSLGTSGPNSYKRPHPPIPVRVTGSLFWDVDHKPGAVGPDDFKPKTSWEIHPVSEIEFLENVSTVVPSFGHDWFATITLGAGTTYAYPRYIPGGRR